MALIVEDGSMVAGAESYASVTYANNYFISMGNEAWGDLDVSAKEQALRKATQYMQNEYFSMWQGVKRVYSQALDWPRDNVIIAGSDSYYPNNIIPNEVKNSCCLLALKASSGAIYADKERAIKREKVDVLETEYFESDSTQKEYREIDAMLRRYMISASAAGGALPIVRV